MRHYIQSEFYKKKKKYKCPLLEKMRGKLYYFPRTFEVFWDILKREKKNEE